MSVTFLRGLAVALLLIPVAHAAELDTSRDVVATSTTQAIASQARIDTLSAETKALLTEFRRLTEGVEYAESQRRELEVLRRAQSDQIATLKTQIATVKMTRQRILPLMRSMAESLQAFVALDLPFHQEQRLTAVLSLQKTLSRADLSVSSRLRMLLEAYQLEQDYGNTIEAWRGTVEQNGDPLSVEFLRIGRVALYYHHLDGSRSAYWDRTRGTWQPLQNKFNRPIASSLKIARNGGAPQLLLLPLLPPEDAL